MSLPTITLKRDGFTTSQIKPVIVSISQDVEGMEITSDPSKNAKLDVEDLLRLLLQLLTQISLPLVLSIVSCQRIEVPVTRMKLSGSTIQEMEFVKSFIMEGVEGTLINSILEKNVKENVGILRTSANFPRFEVLALETLFNGIMMPLTILAFPLITLFAMEMPTDSLRRKRVKLSAKSREPETQFQSLEQEEQQVSLERHRLES